LSGRGETRGVYGGNSGLREWLPNEMVSYMLALARDQMIAVPTLGDSPPI
jgi:hypothetical protein